LDKPPTSENSEAWHNPLAPSDHGKSYGTEQVGACSLMLIMQQAVRQEMKPQEKTLL